MLGIKKNLFRATARRAAVDATRVEMAEGPGPGPRRGPTPPPGDQRRPGGGQPQPSRGLFGVVMIMLVALGLFMVFNTSPRGQEITLASLETRIGNREIQPDKVVIRELSVEATAETPDGKQIYVVPFNMAAKETVVRRVMDMTNDGAKIEATSVWPSLFVSVLPVLLIILLIYFLVSRSLRGAGGAGGMLGNFGKSRHRTLTKEMTGITFNDVAGIDEAKDEVTEIIEFLKNPKKFTKLGGRIPRGVLLIGEPGCGKTLLAKAIAGEADVPFFSISGSDFVEMFVGVGASRVRDLFKQAKDSAPCIIFLDEIDAVGRRRGGGFNQGGHDEREQTLNAILVEMDGFTPSDGVIVIAATNRADVLDPALIRPGRFDRQVTVPLPDVKGRLEILRVHAKKVKLGPDVDLEKVARGTPMFSGADLAAIINEAAISATMHNKDFIEHEDLEEARDKVKFGRAKKSRVREKDENKLVAFHEAGHAVLQALLKDADPLHKVTIIARGAAGGATFSLPEKDRMGYSLKWLSATMRVLCGGRIAEERAMGDVSSGASMDISQVTNIARMMILEWGMSEKLGFVRYSGTDTRETFVPDKDYSDDTARLIDEEVKAIVGAAYIDAKRMLDEHWEKVEAVASALLSYETLSGEDVEKLMRGQALSKPSVADLLKAEQKKRADLERPSVSRPPESDLPPGALPSPA